MKPNIPRYHSKDLTVMVLSMLPLALLLNYFLFGSRIFQHPGTLAAAVSVAFVYLSAAFISYGAVAVYFRNRLPSDRDLYKRIGICLGVFYLMSAVYISLFLFIYDAAGFFGYKYREIHFIRSYAVTVVINTFLTFFNEGLYRFEKLKENITRNEQLKKEYMQSRLLGLKSQMNPHFLFNSLNALSGLIQEDEDRAEEFLNHMSKVYRYLLRNRDEKLVPLETEISFIRSYAYLLNQRHGEAVQLQLELSDALNEEPVPPLTLQMLLENAVNNNAADRSNPLIVTVSADAECLIVTNTVQPKMNNNGEDREVLDNISNKYRLLCRQEMMIEEKEQKRIIKLPLLNQCLVPA